MDYRISALFKYTPNYIFYLLSVLVGLISRILVPIPLSFRLCPIPASLAERGVSYLTLSQSYPQLLSHSATDPHTHVQSVITVTALAAQIYSDLAPQQQRLSQAEGGPSLQQQHPSQQQQLPTLQPVIPSANPSVAVNGSAVQMRPPSLEAPVVPLSVPDEAASTALGPIVIASCSISRSRIPDLEFQGEPNPAVQGKQPSFAAVAAVMATTATAGSGSGGGSGGGFGAGGYGGGGAASGFSPFKEERPVVDAVESAGGAEVR